MKLSALHVDLLKNIKNESSQIVSRDTMPLYFSQLLASLAASLPNSPRNGPQNESDTGVSASEVDQARRQARRIRNLERAERRLKTGKQSGPAGPDTLAWRGLRLAKPCSYCHVPYHHRMAPFSNMKLVPCMLCGKKWVPETILSTAEPPSRLPVRGAGVLVEARVCR